MSSILLKLADVSTDFKTFWTWNLVRQKSWIEGLVLEEGVRRRRRRSSGG